MLVVGLLTVVIGPFIAAGLFRLLAGAVSAAAYMPSLVVFVTWVPGGGCTVRVAPLPAQRLKA